MKTLNKMIRILRKLSCKLNLHKYEKYILTREIRGINGNPEITVPIRECKWCGKKEHHLLPRTCGMMNNWRPLPKDFPEYFTVKKR